MSFEHRMKICNNCEYINIVNGLVVKERGDRQEIIVRIFGELLCERDPEKNWYELLEALVFGYEDNWKKMDERVRDLVRRSVWDWFNGRFIKEEKTDEEDKNQ